MVNLAEKHDDLSVFAPGEAHGFAHGKIDPREAGRRGGIASGASRRLKDERRLEARVLELRNGQAIYSVLRDKRARDAELARARQQADRDLVELEYQTMDEQARLAEAREELRRLDEQLEQRRAQAEAAMSDDDALIAYLRDVGEKRVETACVALGWAVTESESADVVA